MNKKIIFYMIFSVLFIIFLTSSSGDFISFFLPKRVKTDYFKQDVIESKAISRDFKIFYHKGTHFELGQKYGEAIKKLGVFPRKLSGRELLIYKEQRELIVRSHPLMIDYLKGVAYAYGMDYEKNKDDYNFFIMVMIMNFACSAVFVNSSIIDNNVNVMAKNFDFPEYLGNIQDFRLEGVYRVAGDSFMFGYPYMLNGINEKGLAVMANMNLDSVRKAVKYPYPLPDYAGIESTIAVRIVLETCRDAAEARKYLSKTNIHFSGPPVHFLIADSKGDSFIAEIKPDKKGSVVFVERDIGNEYQIMTNFPIDTNGYKRNNGYKEGKCIRFETLEKKFEDPSNKQINFDFIHESLDEVMMSGSNRKMNQGMGDSINTVIQMIYDLNNKKAYYYNVNDGFKKSFIIDLDE